MTEPRTVHLPGLPAEPVGLGDVVAKAATALGIKPCSNCQKRRERLNRLRFAGRTHDDAGGEGAVTESMLAIIALIVFIVRR